MNAVRWIICAVLITIASSAAQTLTGKRSAYVLVGALGWLLLVIADTLIQNRKQ